MLEAKYKKAQETFQNKINLLKKKRVEILANISRKFDEQKIEALRQKLKQ